jgi:hypothetical protein
MTITSIQTSIKHADSTNTTPNGILTVLPGGITLAIGEELLTGTGEQVNASEQDHHGCHLRVRKHADSRQEALKEGQWNHRGALLNAWGRLYPGWNPSVKELSPLLDGILPSGGSEKGDLSAGQASAVAKAAETWK